MIAVAVAVTIAVATVAGPPAPPPGQVLSPEVAALPASSTELDAAVTAVAAARDRAAADRAELDHTTSDLDAIQAERAGVTGLAARRNEQVAKAEANLARVRADLRALATEWFVRGSGDLRALDPTLTASQVQELGRQQVMAETAAADTVADERFVAARLAALRADRDRLTARRDDLDGRTGTLAARRDRLIAAVQRDDAASVAAVQREQAARLHATIDGTDMATIALDAYWRAANDLRLLAPRCGMSWWALAGIGRTESAHGTYLGAEPGVDGEGRPPILGPPLDGSNGFAVVRDSDRGLLDGTATTDRAVGPMQFLPSTWRTVGRDATGDGVADPQNLYDAALAAGVYLCRAGPVTDDAGLRRAYYSYNRSGPYVDVVTQRAIAYRDAVALPSTG